MHPSETDLALYAGGELNWWRRRIVARHLRGCPACVRQVAEFRHWREWVRREEELPPGVHWGRLAAEMKANIHLGLAAGECAGPLQEPRAPWRPAALALPLLVMLLAGWLLQVWHPPLRRPAAPRGPVLAATSSGVELRHSGGALSLLHPRADGVSRFAGGGGVRTRYIDAETGYVTISHVFAE